MAARHAPLMCRASWIHSVRSSVQAASSAAQCSPVTGTPSKLPSSRCCATVRVANRPSRRRSSDPVGSVLTAASWFPAFRSTRSSESAGRRQSHHHVRSLSSMRSQAQSITSRSARSAPGDTTASVMGGSSRHPDRCRTSRCTAPARLPQNALGGARSHRTSSSTSSRSERRSRKSVCAGLVD